MGFVRSLWLGMAVAGCAVSREGVSCDGTTCGVVFLRSDGSSTGVGDVYAAFYSKAIYLAAAGGTLVDDGSAESIGPCTIFAFHTPLDYPLVNAGVLDVVVGQQSATIPPGQGLTYAHMFSGPLWRGDEVIRISASGSEIPSFTGTLRAPLAGTITQPVVPPGMSLSVSRSDDLHLSWTETHADVVEVLIDGVDPANDKEWDLVCTFAASAAEGIIPAAALAKVPYAGGGLYIHTSAQTDVRTGQYAARLIADSHQLWPDGNSATAGIRFQ